MSLKTVYKSNSNELINGPKKKISLVEGKRRAMFNKFEQEKSVNREKEKELDVELKVPQFNFFTFCK